MVAVAGQGVLRPKLSGLHCPPEAVVLQVNAQRCRASTDMTAHAGIIPTSIPQVDSVIKRVRARSFNRSNDCSADLPVHTAGCKAERARDLLRLSSGGCLTSFLPSKIDDAPPARVHKNWCFRRDSNPELKNYDFSTLTVELHKHEALSC